MRRLTTAGLALGLCIGLFAGPALAGGGGNFKTRVSITNPAPGTYEGRVRSDEDKCVRGRSVAVYHDVDENGKAEIPPDFLIGQTKTNKKGRWKLTGEEQPPPANNDHNLLVIVDSKSLGDGEKGCLEGKKRADSTDFGP